jgi:hypothetical protein
MFFFEKKNQKTLGLWRTVPGERTRQGTKVFCFFSSEKKTLPSWPKASSARHHRMRAIIPVVLCPGTSSANTTRPPAAVTTSPPTT